MLSVFFLPFPECKAHCSTHHFGIMLQKSFVLCLVNFSFGIFFLSIYAQVIFSEPNFSAY